MLNDMIDVRHYGIVNIHTKQLLLFMPRQMCLRRAEYNESEKYRCKVSDSSDITMPCKTARWCVAFHLVSFKIPSSIEPNIYHQIAFIFYPPFCIQCTRRKYSGKLDPHLAWRKHQQTPFIRQSNYEIETNFIHIILTLLLACVGVCMRVYCVKCIIKRRFTYWLFAVWQHRTYTRISIWMYCLCRRWRIGKK